MFSFLSQQTDRLLREVIEIAYHMNGAIQYDDLMWRAPVERQAMRDYIESMIEARNEATRRARGAQSMF